MTSPPKYQTTRDTAALLGVTERWLQKLRMSGDGPEFVKFGRAVRYDADAVRAWAASRARKSTSQAA